MRWLMAPFAAPYALVTILRNKWYDRGAPAVWSAGVPVISVGNITAGGTGKTPMVIEIVRRLIAIGRRPAILTRGYGARPGEPADEVREFAEALPATPVVVNPDRVSGAQIAERDHRADCLVLDDGFQHRRLARDLDIVLIDATAPWGGGWVFPAGRLREPLHGLERADAFVITRCNQADAQRIEEITARLAAYADVPILRADIESVGLRMCGGDTEELESLGYSAVLPVCGIGNPATFLRLVDGLAGRVCPPMRFADHHRYRPRDLQAIQRQASAYGADIVLTTRKDWVKLGPLWDASAADNAVRLARLDVRTVLQDDQGDLDAAIGRAVGVDE